MRAASCGLQPRSTSSISAWQVITLVVRQSGRERLCEAAVCKLLAPPADDVGAGSLTCLFPHVFIGVLRGATLTCRKFNRSASESAAPGRSNPEAPRRGKDAAARDTYLMKQEMSQPHQCAARRKQ